MSLCFLNKRKVPHPYSYPIMQKSHDGDPYSYPIMQKSHDGDPYSQADENACSSTGIRDDDRYKAGNRRAHKSIL